MVSSTDVIVNVISKVDTTDLQKAEVEAERVMSKMERVISFVKTNSNKLLRSMQSAISLFSNVLKAVGVTLGPVGEALLSTISVVLMSIIQMQSMLAAGTGGLSLLIGAEMIAISISLSIISSMEVMRGMSNIQGQLNSAQAAAQSAISLFNIWR